METQFVTVGDAGALDELFARSHEAPTVKKRVSTPVVPLRCSISKTMPRY